MAETQTPNFQWTKPDLGGDASVWGNVLNRTIDAIDSVAWNNQQAGAPIGTVSMFAGATAPTNWLFCNGAVYLDTDIPALAPILAKKFAGSDSLHTALPNLNGTMPIGCDFSGWAMGAFGGEYNHILALGEMPVHAHSASQAAHTHPGSYEDAHNHVAWQDAHAHTVAQGTHYHNIVTGNHSHAIATGGHAHGTNLVRFIGSGGSLGLGAAPNNASSGNTDTAGNLGGNTDTAGNLGGYTDSQYPNVGNTDTRTPNVYTGNAQPALHIDTQQPAVTVANAGSGATHNNMPPYLVIAFIIRYR